MKCKDRMIAIILAIALVTAVIPSLMFGETTAHEGLAGGNDVIKNASFVDVTRDKNVDNILKMAVYSVVREYGSTKYYPASSATRQDILASLVRAIGKQEQAIQEGDAIKTQDSNISSTDAYLRGHIQVAKDSGIITDEEIALVSELTQAEIRAIESEVNKIVKSNWKTTLAQKNKLLEDKKNQKSFEKAFKSSATREETAIWIARALGLSPVTGEQTMTVYGFNDWKSLKTGDLPYIEAVLRAKYMSGNSSNSFSPKSSISKSEMASILNEITKQNLDKLGYYTGYGEIVNIQNINTSSAFGKKNITETLIQTPEGDSINITINNINQSVPVIKNGKVGNQGILEERDVVEYTINNDSKVQLFHVGEYKEIKGTYKGYNQQSNNVYLADENGKEYTLTIMPDTIVQAEEIPVDIRRAEIGTPITAIYAGSTLKSLELKVSPETINTQEKIVKIMFADLLGNIIKVSDENGNKQYMDIDTNISVYMNDEISNIEAIGFDQDAVLTVSGNKIIEARIYTDIPFEEKQREIVFTAKVREVISDNIILTRDDEPDSQIPYIIDNNTSIIKDKQLATKSGIKQGDKVKVYVDSVQEDYITKLEIQGEGLLMKNLYKGEIKEVIENTGELVLTNVYTYGYYDWVKVADYLKLDTAYNAKIYKNSSSIDLADLKQYLGKSIYAASKENYGDEELVQMVVKEGFEDALYKKIDDIKWTSNQLTLSDGRLVNFLEGSIIIRDGRLLDTLDLVEESGAFIIQNKSFTGIGTAPVIGLDSFNGISDYKIAKGYLHNMGNDYYTIENSYKLSNNQWDKWKELSFYLSDDTYVWDGVITNGYITADKFAESRFKPYTYTWPNFEDSNGGKEYHEDNSYHSNYSLKNTSLYHEHCLVYTIADAYGNTQAINIFRKDKESFNPLATNTERMIAGRMSSVDIDNELLTLKQVMDYSPVYENWQPVNAEVPIDLAKAVIIKNNKVITADDIRDDDSIYVLANDGYAIFIIVQ